MWPPKSNNIPEFEKAPSGALENPKGNWDISKLEIDCNKQEFYCLNLLDLRNNLESSIGGIIRLAELPENDKLLGGGKLPLNPGADVIVIINKEKEQVNIAFEDDSGWKLLDLDLLYKNKDAFTYSYRKGELFKESEGWHNMNADAVRQTYENAKTRYPHEKNLLNKKFLDGIAEHFKPALTRSAQQISAELNLCEKIFARIDLHENGDIFKNLEQIGDILTNKETKDLVKASLDKITDPLKLNYFESQMSIGDAIADYIGERVSKVEDPNQKSEIVAMGYILATKVEAEYGVAVADSMLARVQQKIDSMGLSGNLTKPANSLKSSGLEPFYRLAKPTEQHQELAEHKLRQNISNILLNENTDILKKLKQFGDALTDEAIFKILEGTPGKVYGPLNLAYSGSEKFVGQVIMDHISKYIHVSEVKKYPDQMFAIFGAIHDLERRVAAKYGPGASSLGGGSILFHLNQKLSGEDRKDILSGKNKNRESIIDLYTNDSLNKFRAGNVEGCVKSLLPFIDFINAGLLRLEKDDFEFGNDDDRKKILTALKASSEHDKISIITFHINLNKLLTGN